MRKLMLAALSAVTLAACSSEQAASDAEPIDIEVALNVAPTHVQRLANGCEARPLVGVAERTPVVIRNDSGTTIGASQFAAGIVQTDGSCVLSAQIEVSETSDFYEVTIGRREPVTMPADRVQNGSLALRVGY
ncbi:hypothetical protein [Rhodococcoides fascians]|uniref:hypothetical protein n=1 Tax=Rhodococcoides fascians TaxID=1828 RepID=UPI000565E47B|nr:hypothetical protein [Rhodococcus fascians]